MSVLTSETDMNEIRNQFPVSNIEFKKKKIENNCRLNQIVEKKIHQY